MKKCGSKRLFLVGLLFGFALSDASNSYGQGTVVAWGDNRSGQTTVPVGLTGVTALAGGDFHTVALKSDGTVVAWGSSQNGQTTVPVGLSGVTAIAAGGLHTVALKSDGTVVAWGSNQYGQTSVPAGLNSVGIAAGHFHTVALKSDGTVVAWGRNDFGQTSVPVGLSGVTAVAAGADHCLALKSDGTVVGWGNNSYGQRTAPAGLSTVVTLAAGLDHTVALKSDGTVVAWGYNAQGQTTVPAGLSGVIAITAGGYHTMALKSDNTVVAWGWNGEGQLNIPAGLSGVAAIAAGNNHSVAVSMIPPGISTHPVALTVNVTSNATFTVTAIGTDPLAYQWRKDGVNLAGATTATLSLLNVQTNQAGGYSVVITNAFGSITSTVASLTVNRLVQTVIFGPLLGKRADDGPFTLTATASSGLPVSFSSSDSAVATVSGKTVTLTGVGSTTITASQGGNATFQSAANVGQLLSVSGIPPNITTGAAAQLVSVGAGATFNVTATGTGPLSYQWYKNGTPIGGANASLYTISNAQQTDAASYSVVVTNSFGRDSSGANLVVRPTGAFAGADTFSAARSSSFWGVNDYASAGSALVESGGKLVLTGTATPANEFQVSAGRVWQQGLAPYASDWSVAVDVAVSNAVFTGANQKAKWELLVVNASDPSDVVDLRLQGFDANGQFVRSETEINGVDGPTLNSMQGVGETVRLRMAWTASSKVLALSWVTGGSVSNFLGSYNLGAASPTEFANCTGFVLFLNAETEGMSPLGAMAADNLTLTSSASVITSPSTASGFVGQAFSYQITADNSPTSYNATGLPAGLSVNTATGLIAGTPMAAGSSTVTLYATNAVGTGTQTLTLTVNRQAQTIAFGGLPGKQVGDAQFNLAATASSGLSVSYTSSNPSVATVSGNTVTVVGVGSTTITASQSGNGTYLPAVDVSQILAVGGVPPTITTPPVGQSFTLGGGLTLGVSVGGTGPLSYQWQFNGNNIPGASSTTLTLANLTATNAGAYRVAITNSVGTATSLPVDVYFFGDLKLMAATVLAGSVGQQYRVDYADVVTVGTTNWLTLTNVTLPYSPFLVIDPASPGKLQRYYRAVPLP